MDVDFVSEMGVEVVVVWLSNFPRPLSKGNAVSTVLSLTVEKVG